MMNEEKIGEQEGHGSSVRRWGVKLQLSKGEIFDAKKGKIISPYRREVRGRGLRGG